MLLCCVFYYTNLFEKEKEKEIYENEESGICANDGK